MLHIQRKIVAMATATLMLGVWAGELDLSRDIQKDFKMGLFARQEQQGNQVGLSDLNVRVIYLPIDGML